MVSAVHSLYVQILKCHKIVGDFRQDKEDLRLPTGPTAAYARSLLISLIKTAVSLRQRLKSNNCTFMQYTRTSWDVGTLRHKIIVGLVVCVAWLALSCIGNVLQFRAAVVTLWQWTGWRLEKWCLGWPLIAQHNIKSSWWSWLKHWNEMDHRGCTVYILIPNT